MLSGAYKRLRILALALFFTSIISTTSAASNSLPPRFSANAYASDYTVGQVDLMLPLHSNNTHIFMSIRMWLMLPIVKLMLI